MKFDDYNPCDDYEPLISSGGTDDDGEPDPPKEKD